MKYTPRIPERLGPTAPRPLEKAPHKDVGRFASDLLGDMKSVGEEVSSALDQPIRQTVDMEGPHRVIDNALDWGVEMSQNAIDKILRR